MHDSSVVSSDALFERLLIQRAQRGEAEALEALYQRHAPGIYRYILFRVRDRAVAEDLTGEVFIRMIKSVHGYHDRGRPFASWLYRIAHDRAVDYIRHVSRHQLEALTESALDLQPGPESQVSSQAEARRIAAAVAGLSDEQRLVVQLRFVEGHNLEETARLMQKSVGAIKALQHRALQNLAKRLQR